MTSEQGLFRQEAIDARRGEWLGTIHVATPLSRWMLTGLGLALAVAIMAFLLFGHYTRRERVTGQLVPSTGLVNVSAPYAGTVMHVFVSEGQHVHRGDRLLGLVDERTSAALGETRRQISRQLRNQRKRLREDLVTQKQRSKNLVQTLEAKVDLLHAQLAQIDAQLALQEQQSASARALLARIQPLRDKGYVSAFQIQQQEADVLKNRAQIKVLARQRIDTRQQLSDTRQKLRQSPLDLNTQDNDIERKLDEIDQRLAQNEAQRAIVLRAPREGVISALLPREGQNVGTNQSLLSILPQGASLQAQLLVPSRAVGFVEPGSRVVLRYQAYPYQKFGQQYGRVKEISRSALGPSEVTALVGQQAKEPLYRIKVQLDNQDIHAYGKPEQLKPGMALDADILMDRRRLIEWVFEPLYGLGQRTLAKAQEMSRG